MITLQLIGFIIIVCRFPNDGRKLRAWKKAINRDNFVPNEYTCTCSEHFVSGWHSDDPDDVNYAPTMFSYCLLYTSDAADDMQCVDLGGRRIIKKVE